MRARRSHRGAEAVPSRRPITDAGHITNGWCESLRQELLPDVRVTLIEPGAVATELPNHITHAATKQGVTQAYSQVEVTAEDIAEVIEFVVSRPKRLAIHEVLLRPAGQQL